MYVQAKNGILITALSPKQLVSDFLKENLNAKERSHSLVNDIIFTKKIVNNNKSFQHPSSIVWSSL